MATIKFLIQSKKESAAVYCRLSIDKKTSFKRKTGLISDEKTLKKLFTPKPSLTDQEKKVKSSLEKLRLNIIDSLNRDFAQGELIDGYWLESTIEAYFGRGKKDRSDLLTDYTAQYIKDLEFKVSDRKGVGVSEKTKRKYMSIHNKLLSFERLEKRRFRVAQVDLQFRMNFLEYLTKVDGISSNTAGRYIKFVKTFVLDAQKNGLEVSRQLNEFRGFTLKPAKVTFSFDEIRALKESSFEDTNLESAKDWLIIGCYVGQRVSDLLRMNKSMIQSIKGFELIVITQQKTGKTVQIPVHFEVKRILEKRGGDFPAVLGRTPDSNSAIFNRQIKEVSKVVGFDSIAEGKVYSKEQSRYVHGKYPKWRLVSSHICRRSFATNFYSDQKYPTPLLMNITAHSTEKMFLEYIDKPPLDYSLQLAETWAREEVNTIEKAEQEIT
jgi:integrase